MTREQFNKLEPFNLKKYAKGAKVAFLFGNEVVYPEEQRYYPDHPYPVVLKVSGNEVACCLAYAQTTIRMVPKERYQVRFGYNDLSQKSMVWNVVDTKLGEVIGSFGTKIKEGAVKAGNYAKYLNDVEKTNEELRVKEQILDMENKIRRIHNYCNYGNL